MLILSFVLVLSLDLCFFLIKDYLMNYYVNKCDYYSVNAVAS